MDTTHREVNRQPHHRDGLPISARRFVGGIASFLMILSFLCIIVALAVDAWSHTTITTPDEPGIDVVRGLFNVKLQDDYGITINAAYFADDINDMNRDPYCGDDDDTSFSLNVYAQFLDRLAVNPNLPDETWLAGGVCCGPDSMIPATRTYETNDWCSIRDATIGLAIVACIAAGIGAIATLGSLCFETKYLYMIIICAVLTGLLGLAATIVFSVWLAKEDNDIENREFQEDIDGSVSYALFIVGWVLAWIAALTALLAFFVDDHYHRKETDPRAYPYVTSTTAGDHNREHQLEAVEVPPLSPHAAAAKAGHPGRNHPDEVNTKPALATHPGRNHPDDANLHNDQHAAQLGRNHPDEVNKNPPLAAHPGRNMPHDGNLSESSLDRAIGKGAGGDKPPLELHPGRYAPTGSHAAQVASTRPSGGKVIVDADAHERATELAVASRSKV